MIAHNLGIPKIMKLIYQTVVKRLMFCVPDHLHPDRPKFFESAVDGGLINMDKNGRLADVIRTAFCRRVFDQPFSVKGQQQFPASHVLDPAAGLNPVPVFAKFPGYLGPTFVPVLVNHGLDNGQIIGGNFAVSDDQRFHEKAYSKKKTGTPAKNARI
jgi:hypothetical protein